ncbi:MAG: glycosyltransferase family 4 protein [Acidimicrobiaceae bacterium]|nr:glycosyltransferase family 4 protein [Acidimicrobiaceae bacterium]
MGTALAKRVFLIAEQLRSKVPGGIGTHTSALLGALSTIKDEFSSLELEIVATRPTGSETLDKFGIPVRYIPVPHKVFMRLSGYPLPLLGRKPGIYHSFSMFVPPVSGPIQRRVCTVHDLAFSSNPNFFTKRGVQWHARQLQEIARGDFPVVAVSQRTKKSLLANGIEEKRVFVIEPGADHLGQADLSGCQQLLKSLGVQTGFILSVSTQEPRKNLDGLIGAYQLAKISDPLLPELLIVGPSGWGPSIKRVSGVHFLGRIPEPILVSLYQLASLLVYVPFEEGFGLPVVEAMFQGLAVVGSDVPAAGESVELVDPNSMESIAKGISRLIKDSRARQIKIDKGLDRVKKMTWVNSARCYMDLWERM